ncbi:MAG: hypothetical protein WKF30_01875 [Pyrinomonadaceae bacterium]
MKERPLRTTVVGSYPLPGWLEFSGAHLEQFGAADLAELQEDAVIAAIHDQTRAGLDVITDGEQTRLDFNLSFYGFLEGIEVDARAARRFGPPAHDQRGKHRITGDIRAPRGLGVVEEWQRLRQLAPAGPALKASVPGPFTLSGRLEPNAQYPNRYAVAEALLPVVRDELEHLVAAGCREITIDEPSMSCYAHREDPFASPGFLTARWSRWRAAGSRRTCAGNYQGSRRGPPALRRDVSRLSRNAGRRVSLGDGEPRVRRIRDDRRDCQSRQGRAVGIIDVKSYYIETAEDVSERVHACLKHAPAERLSFAPDCGLSQTARWAARLKLGNMVAGVRAVREELSL